MRCKTGKHEWLNQKDADKCCNGYVRILVLGGGDNQQNAGGVSVGRAWLPVAQTESGQAQTQSGV